MGYGNWPNSSVASCRPGLESLLLVRRKNSGYVPPWDGKIRLWELATKQERAVYLPAAGKTFDPQAAAPPGPVIKRANVTTKDLDALWTDLAGSDAKKAYQAILTLARSEKRLYPISKIACSASRMRRKSRSMRRSLPS